MTISNRILDLTIQGRNTNHGDQWQDFYPERLGKFFIVHVPYIFMTIWKIVYPFIDKKTRKKVSALNVLLCYQNMKMFYNL